MKKVLLIVAVVLVGCIALCAGVVFWAQQAGSQVQAKFFSAVESGDVTQVEALMDPLLREQIDAPVLEAWIEEVRSKLGKFQGPSKTDLSTSTKYEGGAKVT